MAEAGPVTGGCLTETQVKQMKKESQITAPSIAADMDRNRMPEPVFEIEPGFVELYWKAWELAYAHVLSIPGLPQSHYMDEGFQADTLWIWDTCFMALFCRYAPDQFPGIESLQNFYAPIHDGFQMPLIIQHADNPPLFAWVERDYFQFTGDVGRLHWLLEEKQYLQKHYDWFQNAPYGEVMPWGRARIALNPHELGFQWSGVASGMDNSPRFASSVLAIDAIAQQGLAARSIAELATRLGNTALAIKYASEFDRNREFVNRHYWDEEDGFYYDLMPDGITFSKVRTPASFWPVLAGMASPQQVARMASYLRDPNELGGAVPWVTLSRFSKDFNAATGDYWKGAVWLPTAYMGIRALGENGQPELADLTAEQVLRHMLGTYRTYDPHTIWECYNPLTHSPAKHGKERVRPDFCGWSALGPISLFIENVIGLHHVSAIDRCVKWRLHQAGRHGIRRLRFGEIQTDLIADGNGFVEVASSHPYTLEINGISFDVLEGPQCFEVRLC